MKKLVLIVFSFIFISIFSIITYSYPETIKLKSGKTLDAKIIEKTDKYIKVNISGIPITYYLEDIEAIDGIKVSFSPTSTTSFSKEPKDIFEKLSPAIVYITCKLANGEESIGSGFIVDKDGIVVTNYHVVYGAKEINVKLRNGNIYPLSSVIYNDAHRDIFIFKIEASNLPVIPLGDSDTLKIGEKVYVIGHTLGLEYSFSDGMLSGKRDFGNLKWLQFTAPVSFGNSGGPLINSKGEAVGVVSIGSIPESGVVLQNVNFALAINEVKPYLSLMPKMTLKEIMDSPTIQAEYFFMRGNEYYRQGNYDSAIAEYNKALQLNPNDASAYNNLGLAYESLGQYQKAIEYLQKSLQLDPNDALAYYNLGVAYGGLGQYQNAIEYFQKSLQLNPNNVEAYTNLGAAYVDLGQYQQAIEYCQKAIQLDPNNALAYNNLGVAYGSLGQYQKEIEYCQKAIQINPNYALAYYNLGTAYGSLRQYQKAIEYLQKSLQSDPNDASAYNNLGTVYYYLGQYQKAKENFLKAKELFQKQGDYQSSQLVDEKLKELP